MGGLGKEWGGLGKKWGGLGKELMGLAGPCTSWGGGYKASGVAGEPWRTWLGWRRR